MILTARRASFILTATVAASALGGLLLYDYFNPGTLGQLPDITAFAEAAITIAANLVSVAGVPS